MSERLLEDGPDCVVVTLSDFGWTGPWSERPATEFTLQADSGSPASGRSRGPPISIGGELGEYMGAAWAAYGAMALRRRVASGGPGGHLDMSMLEAITLMQSSEWLHSQLLQRPPGGALSGGPVDEAAKDGYVGSAWSPASSGWTSPRWSTVPSSPRFPSCGSRSDDGTTETGSANGSIRGCASAPSRRSSNSVSSSGCRWLRSATVRPSRTWITCGRGCVPRQPRGIPASRAPWLMSVAAQAPVRSSCCRGSRRVSVWGQGNRLPRARRRAAARRCAGRRLHRVLGRARRVDALAAFGADVIKIESIQRPDGIRYSGGIARLTTGGSTAGCSMR